MDHRAAPAMAEGALERLGDYRIVREIGRGGMGVVYEAEQVSLGRRVALKVLPNGALSDPRQVERFQREARAAARLHHSNIVPIFGGGHDHGTFYYVMQLIDGQPLDQVLNHLRRLRREMAADAAPSEAPSAESPSEGPLSGALVARSLWQGHFRRRIDQDLPDVAGSSDRDRLAALEQRPAQPGSAQSDPSGMLANPPRSYAHSVAQLGIQVAEALDYAASQGVLHRDVKPANLLLDVLGTVWLTDFGLARTFGINNLTRSGDIVGTVRYLAPERFRGPGDARGDVYALGLTLYEMLALRPAFDELEELVVLRIQAVEPVRLDRLQPELPRDLVTIVHKAMAKEPADRYQTAGALAEDLRRFLDGRPIVARRLSVVERAWRWCRRCPAAATLVALAVVLVGLVTGGGLWLQHQQAHRREEAAGRRWRARQAVEEALEQATRLLRQGRWVEVKTVLGQGESRLDEADSDDLKQQLQRARAELDLAAQLEAIRLNRAIPAAGKLDLAAVARERAAGFAVGRRLPASQVLLAESAATRQYAAAFAQAALDVEGEQLAVCLRESAIREPLVAALDDWAFVSVDASQRARLLQIARQLEPDPKWRDRFRDPAVWQDRKALERLAAEANVAELSSQVVVVLANLLDRLGADAEPFLRDAQRRRPDDFWFNFELGNVLRSTKPGEASGFYRVALGMRPQSSALYNNLGLALHANDQLDEAIRTFRRAIALEAKSAAAHNNLGLALHELGDVEGAIATFRRAIELDPHSGVAHNNLGQALQAQGKAEEAIAAFRRATELDPNLAHAQCDLGAALLRQGHFAEAVTATRRGLALLAGNDPLHLVAQQGL
jgi:serine/threonine protein kinase/Tfp pilus assembly protein PilF